MPKQLVFHERDSFAFDRICDNRSRHGLVRGSKRFDNFVDAMPIDFANIPIECVKLAR